MTDKLKVGVIGAGAIAQVVHLPILKKLPYVDLTAICETDKIKLLNVAGKFNVSKAFTDLQKFFDADEYDAVFILTPTHTHKEIAQSASHYCKNILIEKPIARSASEAKEICDYLTHQKARVMVGMNMRFRSDAMLLRGLVESGELGDPYLIRTGWFKPMSSMQNWFTRKATAGGGVIIDLGISVLDLALWLFNYPAVESVTARGFNHATKEIEDTACAFIKTKDKKVLSMEVSWTLNFEKEIFYCNLFGTNGSGFLNPFRVFKSLGEGHVDLTPPSTKRTENLYHKSYENEVKHFFAAVRGLGRWVATGEEAVSRMKVVDAFYKSIRTNKEVFIKN